MMRVFRGLSLLAIVALGLASPASAEQSAFQPPRPVPAPVERDAIPLYGDQTPGSTSSEVWSSAGPGTLTVRNVTRPTLTPVLPRRKAANGAAVIVVPGGAFLTLAMEHEGWKIARALADRGIAAFVLKYRLIETPRDEMESMRFLAARLGKDLRSPMDGELIRQSKAPEDARSAIAYVRANAARWRIDPARVGIIGFSAGAMTARRVAIDPPLAERPAFIGYVYGPQDAEPVPADAPPMFNAIALDDNLFPFKGFAIAQEWQKARRPVEIHGYQKGRHGFGIGMPGTTSTLMIEQFVSWLAMNRFLSPARK